MGYIKDISQVDAEADYADVVAWLQRHEQNRRSRAAQLLHKAPEDVTPEELQQVSLDSRPATAADAKPTSVDELELRDHTVDYNDAPQIEAYRATLEAEATTNSWCARRLAELCELMQDEPAAIQWWRHAATLGDQDAIDYVKYAIVDDDPHAN